MGINNENVERTARVALNGIDSIRYNDQRIVKAKYKQELHTIVEKKNVNAED